MKLAGSAPRLVVIYDDRARPSEAMRAALGELRYANILRRRRRLIDEIQEGCVGADSFVVITPDTPLDPILDRMDGEDNTRWLRLPACIAPRNMNALPGFMDKIRFALNNQLVGNIFDDEAVTTMDTTTARRLISADRRLRRQMLLELRSGGAPIRDSLQLLDLRSSAGLKDLLSGSTETRAFNAVMQERGVFIKRSADVVKMRAEHNFFHVAPPPMRRFLLPTFDFEEADGMASYRMEHLAAPDAGLQFIHGAFEHEDFMALLDRFFDFLASRAPGEVDRALVEAAGAEQILEKFDNRLSVLAAAPEGRALISIYNAAHRESSFDALVARSRTLIAEGLMHDQSDHLVFGHGDACLSNIIYDRRLGLMRLIDPRGATSLAAGQMHPIYDLAKFSHSVIGGYDFVNNDLFDLRITADLGLELVLDQGGPPPAFRTLWEAAVNAAGWDAWAIRAVELSLFLSMLPLHSDYPRKQLGFIMIAKQIADELEATK